jgi:uncharacterized membrane protein YgcG
MVLKESTKFRLLSFAFLFSLFSMSFLSEGAKGQEGKDFSAILSSKHEIKPVIVDASGIARFKVIGKDTQISYWVNMGGIKKLTEVNVYNGMPGANGGLVVTLSKGKLSDQKDSLPQFGFSWNISKEDLRGPLRGKPISNLVTLMSNGSTYVNAHTDDHPEGAIRGQIALANLISGTGGGGSGSSVDRSSGGSSGGGSDGGGGVSVGSAGEAPPSVVSGTGVGGSGSSGSTSGDSLSGGGSSGANSSASIGDSGNRGEDNSGNSNTSRTCSPIEASEGGSANGSMVCSTSGTDVGNTVKSTSGDSGSNISTEEQRTDKDQGSNTPGSAIESNRSSGSP